MLLESGDVIIAGGDLGAGKTTSTSIGRGLGSEGPIISPTFVLSRILLGYRPTNLDAR